MISYERLSDNLFKVEYKGSEYLYAYKPNIMRTATEGLTEEELNLPTHPRRVINKEVEWSPNTRYFTIGVTSTCNLHCSYCHVAGGDYTDTLSVEMVGYIKKQLAKSLSEKPESLKISFHSDGESLTKQHIMESIMDYLDVIKGTTKVYFTVTSNGTLITEDKIPFIKRLSYVQVSMDGIPELNDKNRGSSHLVIKGIKTLMKAKTEFTIRSTVTPETLDTLHQFIDFLSDLVNPHADDPLLLDIGMAYQGERELDQTMYIDPQHFLDIYLPAKEYAKTKNIGLSTPLEIASMPQNAFCSAVGGTLFTPSGLLSSCTRVTRSDHELADTYIYGKFNPTTLEYDIDKEKYSNLQDLRNVPEDCEKCPALNLCGGATCYLERGPSHCYVRSRLLLIERLKLGGLA